MIEKLGLDRRVGFGDADALGEGVGVVADDLRLEAALAVEAVELALTVCV